MPNKKIQTQLSANVAQTQSMPEIPNKILSNN